MRNKLAFTLALAVLVAVLGGSLANGADVAGTNLTLPGGTPTVPNIQCPAGQILDPVNLICVPNVTPPGTTPPGTGGGGSSGSGSGGNTTTTPNGTTTSPSGSTSVTATPTTTSGGNGKNGGGNGKTGGVGPGKSKNQAKNQQMQNLKPPPPYQANGTPTVGNPTTTIASFGPAPIGVPNFVIDQFEIPPFLLPIYQACGTEYEIPWEVLAGINKIETAFGTNLNVSSAGAMGWMQFIPSTWQAYGVDANGDGRKDPYNPVDAICAAARYLRAAGGNQDLRSAVFSYNHASWYVDEVLLYARSYGNIPEALLGSLTGLTQGAHFPVAANARYADDISARQAIHDSNTARKQYGNAANVIESSPTRRGINIFSKPGAPVVAVNDGVIKQIGSSRKLGHFIVLEDSYGNSFTYAQLGSIARNYPVAKPMKLSAADLKLAGPAKDRKPSGPATKGAGNIGTNPSAQGAAVSPGDVGNALKNMFSQMAGPAGNSKVGDKSNGASLGGQLDGLAGQKVPGYSTFKGYFSDLLGLNSKNANLIPLKKGSHVSGGTVLARLGGSQNGAAPHINFAIRPVGHGAPQIDPKPILDGWKLQESTAIYRAAGKNPFGQNLGISDVLLMSKEALQRRVLADPRLQIYPCGRNDIRTGQVDRRVLATMEFLVAKGFGLTISSLKCGQSLQRTSGSSNPNSSGAGMDIAQVNGIPVAGHQGPGTLSDALIKTTMQLQGTMRPNQVISGQNLPGPVSFNQPDYGDRIHIGFSQLYGSGYYADPFADATNLIWGRIDMGVDFVGNGPINAIGDAVILKTGAPGWPQGGGVLYRLLDGPRAGAVIFVYEGVQALVRPGQRVLAGQPIAQFIPGSIETGFADANGVPLSHAIYTEGMVTPWGLKMQAFMKEISGTSNQQFSQLLKPGQWQRLVQRLGQIQNPSVPTAPSQASTPAGKKQASSAHKGK